MTTLAPVTILTVAADGVFFARLPVNRVRATVGDRAYEIIVVDRGSQPGLITQAAR